MRKGIFIVGTIGILALSLIDWATKTFAIERFMDGHSTHIIPFVDFFLHRNPGITFDIPVPISIVAFVTVGILLFLIDRASASYSSDSAVTLSAIAVIAGATNNLVDRIVHGFTTDYLMFFSTSIINGSDVLIVLGVASIFWYTRHNPHALRNFIQPSPPKYGVISRMFRSVIRFVCNPRHS
ncbi:MAG: signal peptidase II [Patescibacteria group bacterium]